ncbi:MAG TPA: tRNA (adenosine(37)-N6)-dimethylallyltransferase MiaA [Candidatus Bipolaricaulota bacterium]|nr:tRNA (adenosine(37)-N6)-dimethylallyltransferase MiaA [Candidatus Bipolaricaulota bacterium]
MKKRKIIIICGPTGSGKSGLALQIAKEHDGFLIAADSRQIYKHMNIGTNKDQGEWKDGVFYVNGIAEYLVDIIDPKNDFTVADWLSEVDRIIAENPDQTPIIVGGTGLYISALTQGFSLAPASSQKLRDKLNKKFEKKGLEYLVEKLLKLDPEAEELIDLKNPRRVIRALEVVMSSGKKFSEFQQRGVSKKYKFLTLGVKVDKEELYEKINHRVDEMFAQGLVEEIKELNKSGYTCDLPIMKNTIGYQEVCEFIQGRTDLAKAKEDLKINTRHYAKRQNTWFLRDKSIKWVNGPKDAKPLINAFLS